MDQSNKYRIRQANSCDALHLLDCYDSANHLFGLHERANGDLQTFTELLKTDCVFLLENEGVISGWISYRILTECILLSGLYVRKENQRIGIGQRLFDFMINETRGMGLPLCLAKVLKNAPWAVSFYQKTEFLFLESDANKPIQKYVLGIVEENGITQSPWSYVLYKML
ncbi:MAG: GNAT family N-acetyltransferase [Limnochordia bacterium]